MSLPTFPDTTITREDALNQILSSIAMEELGLSHILNAEGEKLQYAMGTIPGGRMPEIPATIDDLLALNKSVRETLELTVQNQMILKSKLKSALDSYETLDIERQFLSCYTEALGNGQTVERNGRIVFDPDSADSVGNCIVLDSTGTVFTISRTGLYNIEWDINLASGESGVVGIFENGEPASGAASSGSGNFSSGTVIHVDTVPFTISLLNYDNQITIMNPVQWEDSAASIRIIRFADAPVS